MQILRGSGIFLLLVSPVLAASYANRPTSKSQKVTQQWKAGDAYLLRWEAHHELTNTHYSFQSGEGEPQLATTLPSLNSVETRYLSDTYLETSAERPLLVKRQLTRGEVKATLDFGGKGVDPLEVTLRSPLTAPDTTVLFRYVPEERIYGKLYDANAAQEEALRGLRLDSEAQGWLPPSAGETNWSVPLSALRALLSPGGEMGYAQIAPGGAVLIRSLKMGVGGSLEALLEAGTLEGTLTARLDDSASSSNPGQLHVLFDFDVSSKNDQIETARAFQLRQEFALGIDVLRANLVFKLKGQGRMVWDATQGRIQAYSLDGFELLDLDLQTRLAEEPIRKERTQFQGRLKVDAILAPEADAKRSKSWTENPKEAVAPSEDR